MTARHFPWLGHLARPSRFAAAKLDFKPNPRQAQVLDSQQLRGILCCSRQWGKSTTVAAKAVHHAVFTRDSLTVVIAPTLRQSAELLKIMRRFLRKCGHAPATDPANRFSMVLSNRSRIVALPADEDNIRGFSAVSLLIIDEASRVPDDVYHAALPFLAATDGHLWLMSTPKGKRGFFYREWISPESGFHKVHSNVEEAPHIKRSFLDKQRATTPHEVFREEYYCEFRDDDSQLFPTHDIDAAYTSDFGPIPARWLIITPRSTELRYFLGLDPGQRCDHSALAVIERHTQLTGERDPTTYQGLQNTTRVLRHIERFPLHTPYTDLVWKVKDLLANPNIERDYRIAIDATGVGAPFLDFLRANGVRRNLFPISITSGESITVNRGTHNIPKRDLMTNLQLMLQNRELQISSQLPHAPLLRDELTNMRRRVDSFEPDRTSQHDDLLMALALAAWNCRK
jgi:hypothetical protein